MQIKSLILGVFIYNYICAKNMPVKIRDVATYAGIKYQKAYSYLFTLEGMGLISKVKSGVYLKSRNNKALKIKI